MSDGRIFYNYCRGEYFRFGGTSDEFKPCSDCEAWGFLDEAPEYIKNRDAVEYPTLTESQEG